MSLPSSLVYLQFHPVAYLLKLQIEMVMADLITKIVRASGANGDYYSGSGDKSKGPIGSTAGRKTNPSTKAQNLTFVEQHTTQIGVGDRDSDFEISQTNGRGSPQPSTGIRKTVETVINSEPRQDIIDAGNDSDLESQSSSTRKLHYHHHIHTKSST